MFFAKSHQAYRRSRRLPVRFTVCDQCFSCPASFGTSLLARCTSRRARSPVLATVRSAGLGAVPYHVDVPRLGDWGFVLAGPSTAPPLRADPRNHRGS